MNANGKDGRSMTTMTISAERAAVQPKRDILAAAVLERARAWFENEENERAYQEWKAGMEAK